MTLSPYTSPIKYSSVQSSMNSEYKLDIKPRGPGGKSLDYLVDQGFHGKYNGFNKGDYVVF